MREYAARLNSRLRERYARIAYCIEDDDEDEVDDVLLERLQSIAQSHYLCLRVYRKREPRFTWFITECSDREFLRSFIMDRKSFATLIELIEMNRVFTTTSGKKKMAASASRTHSLDAHVENLAVLFGVLSGSCFDYIERVTSVLVELYDDVVFWPSRCERKAIPERINTKYDFPNCIGVMDGTLLPLAFKPALNGEDNFTRKGSYVLNALIRCDDRGRVIYALTGWPGLTHDNRVWTNSKICRSPDTFFSHEEYLLGDSAFRASQYVMPPFKKLAGAVLAADREFFNTKLVKIRIRTEHCIGIIKGCFQHFKGIRVGIQSHHAFKRIIRLFLGATVVHNLFVNGPVPPELEDEFRRSVQTKKPSKTETIGLGLTSKQVEGTQNAESSYCIASSRETVDFS